MALSNNEYWNARVDLRMDEYQQDADEAINKTLEAFNGAQKSMDTDVQKILSTFSDQTGLTMQQAGELMNAQDSQAYIDKVKAALVGLPDEAERMKKLAFAEVSSAGYKARITRLEALKLNVHAELINIAKIENTNTTASLLKTIDSAYHKTMFDLQQESGFGFDFAKMSTKQAKEILKNKWAGGHYSENIWNNVADTALHTEKVLQQGMMTGKSAARMADELHSALGQERYKSARIIRTETTYAANASQLQAMKEAGVKTVRFAAIEDTKTSKLCQQADGTEIPMEAARPGKNIPPLHPNCRSSIRRVWDLPGLTETSKRVRDPETGQNKVVPAEMDYNTWKQIFVDKTKDYDEWHKENEGKRQAKSAADAAIIAQQEAIAAQIKAQNEMLAKAAAIAAQQQALAAQKAADKAAKKAVAQEAYDKAQAAAQAKANQTPEYKLEQLEAKEWTGLFASKVTVKEYDGYTAQQLNSKKQGLKLKEKNAATPEAAAKYTKLLADFEDFKASGQEYLKVKQEIANKPPPIKTAAEEIAEIEAKEWTGIFAKPVKAADYDTYTAAQLNSKKQGLKLKAKTATTPEAKAKHEKALADLEDFKAAADRLKALKKMNPDEVVGVKAITKDAEKPQEPPKESDKQPDLKTIKKPETKPVEAENDKKAKYEAAQLKKAEKEAAAKAKYEAALLVKQQKEAAAKAKAEEAVLKKQKAADDKQDKAKDKFNQSMVTTAQKDALKLEKLIQINPKVVKTNAEAKMTIYDQPLQSLTKGTSTMKPSDYKAAKDSGKLDKKMQELQDELATKPYGSEEYKTAKAQLDKLKEFEAKGQTYEKYKTVYDKAVTHEQTTEIAQQKASINYAQKVGNNEVNLTNILKIEPIKKTMQHDPDGAEQEAVKHMNDIDGEITVKGVWAKDVTPKDVNALKLANGPESLSAKKLHYQQILNDTTTTHQQKMDAAAVLKDLTILESKGTQYEMMKATAKEAQQEKAIQQAAQAAAAKAATQATQAAAAANAPVTAKAVKDAKAAMKTIKEELKQLDTDTMHSKVYQKDLKPSDYEAMKNDTGLLGFDQQYAYYTKALKNNKTPGIAGTLKDKIDELDAFKAKGEAYLAKKKEYEGHEQIAAQDPKKAAKIAAKEAEVKQHEKEMDELTKEEFGGIWKDDVNPSDYPDKKASIAAKKQYMEAKMNDANTTPAEAAKFSALLQDLNNFEILGQQYEALLVAATKSKIELNKLRGPAAGQPGGFAGDVFGQARKDAAKWFKDKAPANTYHLPKLEKMWQTMTLGEKRAAYEYTGGSGKFNRPLRNQLNGVSNDLNSEGAKTMIKNLQKALSRSKSDDDMWVQRGVQYDGSAAFLGINTNDLWHLKEADLSKKLVGNIRKEGAFLSTTPCKGQGFPGIIFNVYCPKGTQMIFAEPFSAYGGDFGPQWNPKTEKQKYFHSEFEIILQSGGEYRITKVQKDKNGNIFIDMEVVKQPTY